MGSMTQDLGPIRAGVNVVVVAIDIVIDIDVHVGGVIIDVHVSAVAITFPGDTQGKLESADDAHVDVYGVTVAIDTKGVVDGVLLMLALLRLTLMLRMVFPGETRECRQRGDKRKIAQQEKRDGSDEILGKPGSKLEKKTPGQ